MNKLGVNICPHVPEEMFASRDNLLSRLLDCLNWSKVARAVSCTLANQGACMRSELRMPSDGVSPNQPPLPVSLGTLCFCIPVIVASKDEQGSE